MPNAQEVQENRKGGNAMTEQAMQARREYRRKWNRNNREKVRAAQERYWEKIAAQAEPKGQAPADLATE